MIGAAEEREKVSDLDLHKALYVNIPREASCFRVVKTFAFNSQAVKAKFMEETRDVPSHIPAHNYCDCCNALQSGGKHYRLQDGKLHGLCF